MKGIEAIHRAVVGANEHIKELTVLQDELDRTKKQLEIYHEFVTKLYLNGDITVESLKRLQKRLYIQTKGGDDE